MFASYAIFGNQLAITPRIESDAASDPLAKETSPHMCRLRDLTYAAPIYVDVIYWKGDRRIRILISKD